MPQSTLKQQPHLTPCEARVWAGSGRLPRRPRMGRFNLHVSFQVEQGYLSGTAYRQVDSQAVKALDLPMPTCFRSRSHSYLRAIQAGCSQDDDTGSVDSDETPPTTTSISSYIHNTVSTCTAACRKAPPPIPPRTTSKPFISVTVQSSTESAQDTYLDSQDQRSEVNSQSGRSNSSDSLASSRTGSLVKCFKRPPILPPIPAPREPVPLPSARVTTPPPTIVPPSPAPDAKNQPVSLTVAADEPQAPPKRKLSSIGIQVDCVQPVLKEEQPPTTRFQSIGVQVEDGRPLSRFTSMASRQETTEAESQEQSDGKPAVNKMPSQLLDGGMHKPSRPDVTRCSSASLQETLDPALDPSSLPPPDPSLQAGTGSVNGAVEQPRAAACLRDGRWFQKLLQAETDRMEAWCQQMDQETKDKQLSEEVLGKIRSAVGSAQLLMSQKFQQFLGLCEQNLDANAQPRPTAQDLAGFWDLLQLSIEDISMKFDELHLLRSNDWKMSETQDKKEEKKPAPAHTPKKTVKVKSTGGKEKSGDSVADKQRQEARKRLMAAKRAVSERQNSATESAESIEIYVPEAQTRL
ncbi:disks large-associated protein 4 isoform X2 [Myxocyprinus asiaticus]|uniref:disks large-associated protein 4 isoform X2 n=1 Tax=Myxocyprinus asiaticus TaxID=70543 RepID=UPI0022215E6E|nr:disks large-associated protein 4 isoform X2 [Myxocyprinus asiaticus]